MHNRLKKVRKKGFHVAAIRTMSGQSGQNRQTLLCTLLAKWTVLVLYTYDRIGRVDIYGVI